MAEQKGKSGDQPLQPIIVIKKVVGHGHHGGAWKVAYADFVTSMMSLFIVLWIVNQDQAVKEAVAGYFRDPGAFSASGAGGPLGGQSILPETGQGIMEGMQEQAKRLLEEAADELREQLSGMEHFEQIMKQIEIKMTDSGLNIQMVEMSNSLFFDVGSANLSAAAEEVLQVLARQLSKLPNKLVIEGHTDSRPYPAGAGYSNWELSTERANCARRYMINHGLPGEQVAEVSGYADTRLRHPDNPADVGNRRISITVLYQDGQMPWTSDGSEAAPAGGEERPHSQNTGTPSPTISSPGHE
ncbi:OmpA family protein [bacterium]|nr:OmpA family protein [bacterium]